MTADRQLFQLSAAVCAALTDEEIEATVAALRAANVYSLPYGTIDVVVPADSVCRVDKQDGRGWQPTDFGPAVLFKMVGLRADGFDRAECYSHGSRGWRRFSMVVPGVTDAHAEMMRQVLISLLATRNVRKLTKANKLAKLGIGKRRDYAYTTTIDLPLAEDLSDDDGDAKPTGRTVCPHLRRAHVRNQRFGPGRAYTKLVLIAPVFVNADRDYVARHRTAYNFGGVVMPAGSVAEAA